VTEDEQLMWDLLKAAPNADWVEFRKQHDRVWLTKERQLILIKNMPSDHIIGCVNMLERLGQIDTKAYEGLIKELRKRGSRINENQI